MVALRITPFYYRLSFVVLINMYIKIDCTRMRSEELRLQNMIGRVRVT